MTPGNLPIGADRWTAYIETLQFFDLDLTDAVFAMQVRQIPDAPGDPLIALTTVESGAAEGVRLIYAGTATVAAHVAAGRLGEIPEGYDGGDTLLLSLVGIRINESTMEEMPFPSELGDDLALAWDMHITPSGALKQRYLFGTFTVRAGATQ